ncbi:hypothetical protein ACIB24_09295 [Spongisporangium articulatum]|uniref:Integral membrane protein n=1 Tax=Spongisporangium articulatum TaxID=3362603 RepID=A0ABW8ALK5_9ACTN
MSDYIDFDALGQVLLASLIAGVGLVVVFALGMVGLAGWTTSRAEGVQVTTSGARRGASLAVAVLCFAVVVGGVLAGVGTILAKS